MIIREVAPQSCVAAHVCVCDAQLSIGHGNYEGNEVTTFLAETYISQRLLALRNATSLATSRNYQSFPTYFLHTQELPINWRREGESHE